MVAKAIQFSRCSQCDEDEGRDFEAWEGYVELYERGDFAGLVRLCEATLRRWPDDVNAQYDLGDAYVRNGQPERAIELLTPLHRADPEQIAYQHGILDALFALGRTEKDFPWLRAPRVCRVGPALLDACFRYLRRKRRPRLACELAGAVLDEAYQAFSEDELVAALRGDGRFVVGEGGACAEVTVARGGGRRRGRPQGC